MDEPSELFRRQYELAAHIRDPKTCPRPPDVEDRRMAIYRELFYNNLESLLSSAFPVIRGLLEADHWQGLVRDFLIRHRARSPLFPELPQEFLEFLQRERQGDRGDPPFLLELAHYEWVELALSISDEEPDLAAADPNGDLMAGCPLVSPLAWNLSYRFPVHRIAPSFRPTEPGPEPTHLIVYRNRSDEVEFLEINAVTQRLLELVKGDPRLTGLHALEQIARELQHPRPDVVTAAGKSLLGDLRTRGILIGTRRASV